MGLAVDPGASDGARRRTLLNLCREQGWFEYESENPAGFAPEGGEAYDVVTYSIALPDGAPVTLLAGEVEGFVYATALQYGDEAVAAIAYRVGMVPDDGKTE